MAKHPGIVGACTVIFLLGASATSWAWGSAGHRIVAHIAAKALTNDVRTRVAAILGVSDAPAAVETAMVVAATWPDRINKMATGTRQWHFINIPVGPPFSLGGLCPAHDCVIDRIEEMERRLRSNQKGFTLTTAPSPPRPMTSREIAFLIHFVGDIHQPLHAATKSDLGGTAVHLTVPIPHGQFPTDNLHAVWDDDEVFAVLDALGDESQTAAALFQRSQTGAAVVQSDPAGWARESNALAKTDVYDKLQIVNHKVSVTPAYIQSNVADVEQQLMRAGIRLANVLNDICQSAGCKAKL
jgi:hypothetical protein